MSHARSKRVMQALVIADSYDGAFQPVLLDMSPVLIPIIGVPLLDYTIEFLASAGIGEIWLVCTAHADAVDAHLQSIEGKFGVKVRLLRAARSKSVGDALRAVADADIFSHDFVLVQGPVISNQTLGPLIETHLKHRAVDKLCVMTAHWTQRSVGASPAFASEDVPQTTTVVDASSGQLLSRDDSVATARPTSLRLDAALFQKHPDILVQNDLLDSGVAICAPEVLALFKDHFDLATVPQWVSRTIQDDVQELHVYAAVGDAHSYTVRVASLLQYHQVTSDVLRRWVFPIVPDANSLTDSSWQYQSRPGTYKEAGVRLRGDTDVGADCAIGANSAIGAATRLVASTIGRNCVIGNNVQLRHAHIWDNVVVEDDCVLDDVLVCSDAHLGRGTTLSPGCVVGPGVKIGGGVTVPAHTKLTAHGLAAATPARATVLSHGAEEAAANDGFESDDDDDLYETKNALRDICLGTDGVGRQWTSCHAWAPGLESRSENSAAAAEAEEGEAQAQAQEEETATDSNQFVHNVHGIVAAHASSLSLSFDAASLMVEMNACKFAFDASFHECASALFTGLMQRVDRQCIHKSFTHLFGKCAPVFATFAASVDDQRELLFAIEAFCELPENECFARAFASVLHILYDCDIVDEDALTAWSAEHDVAEAQCGEQAPIFQQARPFIEWLRAAEEDDTDDAAEETA